MSDVTEKEDGTHIISPNFELKEKLGRNEIKKLITSEKVKKAKTVVDKGKDAFEIKATNDIDELTNLFQKFKKNPLVNSSQFSEIKTLALNIKSSAGIYNFPFATEVAKSLLIFCTEHDTTQKDSLNNKSLGIIGIHINTLRTIFTKKIVGNGGETGKTILRELKNLTE